MEVKKQEGSLVWRRIKNISWDFNQALYFWLKSSFSSFFVADVAVAGSCCLIIQNFTEQWGLEILLLYCSFILNNAMRSNYRLGSISY